MKKSLLFGSTLTAIAFLTIAQVTRPPQISRNSGTTSAVFVNGTSISNPNIKDSATVTYSITSGTNINATASGSSGGGLDTSVTTLTWSGTNLVGFNCATNGATFRVLLTNNAFLGTGTFSNLPDTNTMKQWTLMVQQDSTGGWSLGATNSIVGASDGIFPVAWSNASGITWYYFHTDLSTNSTLDVIANVNTHR